MSVIHASNLTVKFGANRVLNGLNLAVEAGECVAILGGNGAGKSTLLKILAGDLRPTRGEVRILSRLINTWTPLELARRRAVLPQSSSLSFPFSVRRVIELGRAPWQGERAHEIDCVEEAARLAHVQDFLDRPYTRLSGGERQRVQWARVLAQVLNPCGHDRLLLLDEPTSSLDPPHANHVLKQAKAFTSKRFATIFVVHDPNLAAEFADRIVMLRDGHVVIDAPTRTALNPAALHETYGVDTTILEHPLHGGPLVVPLYP